MNKTQNDQSTVADLVKAYNLAKHPEGGFYKETYRADALIDQHALPVAFSGSRNVSTAIYYLLPEGEKSRLHRILSDEIWHFYLGGPLEIIEISVEGDLRKTVLGQNIHNGEVVQHMVPAGSWFGARPLAGSEFCFVGCTVAPGFDFADFEMAERSGLVDLFPVHENLIKEMTD